MTVTFARHEPSGLLAGLETCSESRYAEHATGTTHTLHTSAVHVVDAHGDTRVYEEHRAVCTRTASHVHGTTQGSLRPGPQAARFSDMTGRITDER